MAKDSKVTEKTRWNAKVEAHGLHGALTGLVTRFDANELDSSPVKKALKALADVAKEVQDRLDAEAERKARYHAAVAPSPDALVALQQENEELKRRLAAQAVK